MKSSESINGNGRRRAPGLRGRSAANGSRGPSRRHRPCLERLDGRLLLAADVTAFSVAAGTVTFGGDSSGDADTLVLSEVTVFLPGDTTEVRLAHDLIGNGGTGDYEDATDVDPTAGVAHIVIGQGTAPLITVSLGTDDDSLTLDASWTFGHKITYDGGAGSNTLAASSGANTWTMSGANAGNVNGTGALEFSSVGTLVGGDGDDTIVGRSVASTWTLADTLTYNDGSATVTLSGFETLQGGSGVDTFEVTGNDFLAVASGTLMGGDGDDVFNFYQNLTAGSAAFLDGSVDGQGGNDTLSYSGYGTPVTVVLSGTADADGYSGEQFASLSGTFAGIDTLAGTSGGGDYIQGKDVASTWAFGVSTTYLDDAIGNALTFSGFELIQGGSAADAFNLTANSTADIGAGGGDDTFTFNDGVTLTGTLDGQQGNDTLNLSAYTTALAVVLSSSVAGQGYTGTDGGVTGGFSGIDVFAAGSGSDTLTGRDAASTWGLDGTPTYDDGTAVLGFSAFETLQGGTAADTFNVSANTTAVLKGGAGLDAFNVTADGVTLTGSVDGEADGATLSYAGVTTAVAVTLTGSNATGFVGTATSITGGFSNVNDAQGGSGSDTLTGRDVASTWGLDGTPTYGDGTATMGFSAFETLQGGTAADTFNVSANTGMNLLGGADADAFVLADGVAVTGLIDGEAGSDTLSLAAYTTNVSVTLTGSDADGFAGNGTGSTGFDGIDVVLAGGGTNNTLTGRDAASTWGLDGTPTYGDGTASLAFSDFDTLQGGTAADTFNVSANTTAVLQGGAGADTFAFSGSAVLTGTVDGEGGGDTLSFAGYGSTVSVVLTAAAADGYAGTESGSITGGFADIDALTGSGGSDTLTGTDAASTWTLGGSLTYQEDGAPTSFSFSGIETLQGGTAADAFTVSAAVTAVLRGGAGADTFTVATGGALTGSVDGEGGSDALAYTVATAVSVTLTGSGANGFSGTGTGVSAGFSGVDVAQGGSGSDTLTGRDAASTWGLDGTPTYGDGTATMGFSAFETLQGGSGVDTFDVSANTSAALKGGAGLDAFNFSGSAVLTGSVDGDADGASLSYSGYSSGVTVTLTSSTVTGFGGTATAVTGGFDDVSSVTGGASADTLVGRNLDSTWTLDSTRTYGDGTGTLTFSAFDTLQGGTAADTFNILASMTAALKGGDGADTFDFQANGVFLSGKVDGESGTDTLSYSGYTSTVTVNLAAGTATGTTSMLRMEGLVGNSTATTLVGANNPNLWSVTGEDSGGVDNLFLSATFTFSQVRNLTGGSQGDIFMFDDGAGVSGAVNGGSGTDTLNFAGSTAGLTFNVSANNGGSVSGTGVSFNFSAVENLTGGTAADTFAMVSGRTLSGTVNGGGGVDTLSYSGYTTAVRVDLSKGAALNVKGGAGGGVTNVENVTGGSGNDILIGSTGANELTGNGGNDILVGGGGGDTLAGDAGRDIIIGGDGADELTGGGDDDILIAGTTAYDGNINALNALMSEWARTDANYATRIAHLNGSLSGGRNGSYLLNAANVVHDAAVDQLTGGDGLDWFWLTLAQDSVTDLNTGGTETESEDSV